MGTVNASLLQTQLNDSTISDASAETCLDTGINLLNTFGADLDNLTGASGFKTGTYTSAEEGAIMAMAMQVYVQMYKSAGASSSAIQLGGVSESSSSSTSGGSASLLEFAETLANRLKATQTTAADPPIWVSNDPVPTS